MPNPLGKDVGFQSMKEIVIDGDEFKVITILGKCEIACCSFIVDN